MKRPPGLWVLLSAGVLWLSLQNTEGIRATSLIFSKYTSTTTQTPIEASSSESKENEEAVTEVNADADSTSNSNTTKPTLTGNPQMDYIYDPNLPKELNGKNLSDYPFYERVPEDIDFKCDGLHDGFYASVPHKCQVYHHCLFGTRYDFLCANYTAFDQKTFICHFASEVDCANSKKFWHRNDALYQAQSTTTIKPQFIYTPPPQPPAILSGAVPAPLPARPVAAANPPHRRPMKRRRPYDYYEYDEYDDDYYDERPRHRRRKRPRPRRPVYDDEYEEYEEDRYEKRGSGRPYDRRNDRRRNKDRRKYEDDVDEYDPIDTSEDRRRIPSDNGRRSSDRRRPSGDRYHNKRRPIDDDYERPRKGNRRPVYDDDDYEEEQQLPDRRSSEKPKRVQNDEDSEKTTEEPPLVKAPSSIYHRPRAAPKVKPPVPKSEAGKYAYKGSSTESPEEDNTDFYDDYEDEPPPRYSRRRPSASQSRNNNDNKQATSTEKQSDGRKVAAATRNRGHSVKRPQNFRDSEENRPTTSKNNGFRQKSRPVKPETTTKKQVVEDEYYDDYEDDLKSRNSENTNQRVKEHDTKPNKSSGTVESEEEVEAKDKNISSDESERESTENSPKRREKFPKPELKPVTERRPITKDQKLSSQERRTQQRYDTAPRKDGRVENGDKSTSDEAEYSSVSSAESKSEEGDSRSGSKERTYNRNKYFEIRERTTTEKPIVSTENTPRDKGNNIVRIVKRPFLPSRGGNPYSSRGLQPIGVKAADKKSESVENIANSDEIRDLVGRNDKPFISQSSYARENIKNVDPSQQLSVAQSIDVTEDVSEKPFKPSPVVVKVPLRKVALPKTTIPEDSRQFTSRPNFRQQYRNREFEGPRTTQEPKIDPPERNPLDINENEYDVTLNDALNPTLPNLPVRGLPTGFSPATDYSYSNFQRPRYVVDPVLSQASSDYVYQYKPTRQRYEPAPQIFTNTNNDYKGQYSTLNGQVSQPNIQPKLVHHAQTQSYYSNY